MKFLSFFLFGVLNYAISIGLTFYFVKILGISKGTAYFLSLSLIVIISFFSSLYITFRKTFKISIFLRYSVSLLGFTYLNYLLVSFLQGFFHAEYSYYILIFFVTSFVFCLKYFIYDKLVFR